MQYNKLRERRIDLGFSQVQLGQMVGIANSMISDFELGKRLPWPKARKALAEALGMPESELFPNEDQPKNEGK